MTTTSEHLDTWPARMDGHGYTQVSDNRCPRRLVGKRHRDLECWCTSRLNDHAATYRRHGQRLVLWEPYQASAEDLADVFAAALADGLRVTLHGSSPYFPGGTLALEFSVCTASQTDPPSRTTTTAPGPVPAR
jgi:hypothetical protein